jgi:predicted membrane-bound spermidine synthase
LACGAWFGNRYGEAVKSIELPGALPDNQLKVGINGKNRIGGYIRVLSAVLVAIYGAILPLVLGRCSDWAAGLGTKVLFGGLAFLLAGVLGFQFPLANRVEFDATIISVSRLYTADFLGAFVGALLTCTLLIPLLGISATCGVTAALNLLAAGILLFRLRRA